MSPSLEQAIARRLAVREIPEFAPAETLLPVVMRRFGLDTAAFSRDPAIYSLRTVCNACPKVGACWLVLRQGASRDECRALCPNAEALEVRVKVPERQGTRRDEACSSMLRS